MATTQNQKRTGNKKPPVAKVQHGLVIANIWERVTDNGTFYSVTFERRYRDANREWKSTQSFDRQNLLALAKVADLADSEIARLMHQKAAA